MKKFILVLLTLVPCLIGYLINIMLLVPTIGMLLFYVLPFLIMIFWFRLGSEYAKTNWSLITSILIGNMTGILSIALYLWQFLLCDDNTRSTILAGFSQMYSASTPLYLTVRLAVLFETKPNFAGRTTLVAAQIISLILMIVIFAAGYLYAKRRTRLPG